MKKRLIFFAGLFGLFLLAILAASPGQVTTETSGALPEGSGIVIQPRGVTTSADYIVQLSDAPLALYAGSNPNFAATAASATGAVRLDATSNASIAYLDFLTTRQLEFENSVQILLDRDPNKSFSYKYAFNGIAIELTPSEAQQVAALPGVLKLFRVEHQQLLTDYGPQWIGADEIWDGTSTGIASQGENMVVAVLDTGINSDHPSFADIGGDGYDHPTPAQLYGVCDPTDDTQTFDGSFCNDKLIGAFSFVSEAVTPEDSDGHGSHTASTSAGNVLTATINAPTVVLTAALSGVAPHAHIIAMDVCTVNCASTGILAAIDKVTELADVVDAVNFSISGGTDPYNDAAEIAFLGATAAGVFISTSAGNEGPGPDTTGHRSPWLMSVGASTHNRAFINGVESMSGGTTPPADIDGTSLTSGYGPAPIVHAKDFDDIPTSDPDDGQCLTPFPANTFDNVDGSAIAAIVVCDRGTIARVDKGANVLAGGAGGFVLANVDDQGESIVADQHFLPATHIGDAGGDILRAWLDSAGAQHYATLGASVPPTIDDSFGDIMAGFSSRGPNSTFDTIVPDITGPGVSILAAVHSPAGSVVDEYGLLSGTSMSSPHNAGVALLLRSLHPTWTPQQIQSAIMMTAVNTGLLKDDGATPADAFDVGAGRMDVSAAANAGLVMHESEANFVAADPELNGDVKTLNIASMANSLCVTTCSWVRVVENPTVTSMEWNASVSMPAGIDGLAEPAVFTLAPGETQAITVTLTVTGSTGSDWKFGNLILAESGALAPEAHMPIAVQTPPSNLAPLIELNTVSSMGSVTISNTESLTLTNSVVETLGLTAGTLENIDLAVDSTNGDPYDNLSEVWFITLTVGADTSRVVAEIVASTATDIDLFIGFDTNADGLPSEDEQLGSSTTPTFIEYVNVNNPAPGTYWILVQNWAASEAGIDSSMISYAIVDSDEGNLTITVPASNGIGALYDVVIEFDDADISTLGGYWYGSFTIGSEPGSEGDRGGSNIDLHFLAELFLPAMVNGSE